MRLSGVGDVALGAALTLIYSAIKAILCMLNSQLARRRTSTPQWQCTPCTSRSKARLSARPAAACQRGCGRYSRRCHLTRDPMSLRLPAAPTALVFLLLLAAHGRAADFVDSTERYVAVPDRISRVMAADQSAAVLIYVLAPEKLVGWSRPLSRQQRALLPAKVARLPVVGYLTGPNPTAAGAVARLLPDLIVEAGLASPEAAAHADAIQQQTRIPYIILDGSIQSAPDALETVGGILGVGERGEDLAHYPRTANDNLRGRLLITESTSRPLVY